MLRSACPTRTSFQRLRRPSRRCGSRSSDDHRSHRLGHWDYRFRAWLDAAWQCCFWRKGGCPLMPRVAAGQTVYSFLINAVTGQAGTYETDAVDADDTTTVVEARSTDGILEIGSSGS